MIASASVGVAYACPVTLTVLSIAVSVAATVVQMQQQKAAAKRREEMARRSAEIARQRREGALRQQYEQKAEAQLDAALAAKQAVGSARVAEGGGGADMTAEKRSILGDLGRGNARAMKNLSFAREGAALGAMDANLKLENELNEAHAAKKAALINGSLKIAGATVQGATSIGGSMTSNVEAGRGALDSGYALP